MADAVHAMDEIFTKRRMSSSLLSPLQTMPSLLLLAVLFCCNTSTTLAFVAVSPIRTHHRKAAACANLVLGPVARNGLDYQDVTIGGGRRVLPGDTVFCYYSGSFTKKGGNMFTNKPTVFDEIVDGDPFAFPIGKGQVIQGWELGIAGNFDLEIPPMNIGGKRRLKIPPGLAYGEDGNGPIPPNQVLNFDVEILNSEPIGGISMEYRLKGYAVALSVPLVVLAIAWFALTHIQL